MVNIIKKLFLIVIMTSTTCLVSCNNVHTDIKNYSKSCMQLMKEKDSEKLLENFCEVIKDNEKEETLRQLNQLYKYINSGISSYEFVTEGGGTQEMEAGEYTYYNCYPEFNITTDTGKNYTVTFSLHYICNNEPEKKGIYKIEISDDSNNEFVVGHNV